MYSRKDLCLKKGYKPTLPLLEREHAIKMIKDFFQDHLAKALDLKRVTAPLFVASDTGLNDNLNGESPVRFSVKAITCPVEIVHSLAKWKRFALQKLKMPVGQGIYTDMNAVRAEEIVDSIHSVYVDQWDWCKVIEERSCETLEKAVKAIFRVFRQTEYFVAAKYTHIVPALPEEIMFITAEDLLKQYPETTAREREDLICQKYGAVFIMGIGAELTPGGDPHDGRACDYDDWITVRPDGGRGLNGDILVWNPALKRSFEISSMGIRVNAETLKIQAEIRGDTERLTLPFHQSLLKSELPQTMGGGIGQSRLCQFLLRCLHIGEVSVGVWPDEMIDLCEEHGIILL